MVDRKPSPKPIRRGQYGVRSICRIPENGPLTPRLRPHDALANPIGFRADIVSRDDDE
jgi:hypothetical protein